jgi:hypothetical protein
MQRITWCTEYGTAVDHKQHYTIQKSCYIRQIYRYFALKKNEKNEAIVVK